MPPQQLLLSWKDHNGALVSVFENLLKRNTLVDCTLAADGKYLKAHKMVLSACSSYFELLFSQESEKNPIVILKDVKFQELEAAVHFMYRGEVEVCEDRLAAFLEVADSLQIKGLGCDGKTQDFREKSTSLNGSKAAVPPKAHSKKEGTSLQNENTGESCITLDSDQDSNDGSTNLPLHHRERSGSSPIPSTLATTSSYSPASASTSCPIRAETDCDGVKVENNQSSPSVSIFPLGDGVPSDVNTVVKSEPVTDAYLDEKSDEMERDFDDVTMMEDQEDWDDPNLEYMGDDQASNQHDPGLSVTRVKTEESSTEHIASMPPIEHISPEGAAEGAWGRWGGGSGAALDPAAVAEATLGACGSPAATAGGSGGATAAAARHKKYSCALCQKVFSAGNMPRHLRAHLGVRPYPCPDCDYAATDSSNLKRHRRMHTGERPYSCAVCGKTFAYSSALRIHAARHASGRPDAH